MNQYSPVDPPIGSASDPYFGFPSSNNQHLTFSAIPPAASPSVAFSGLTLRTPHRPIPSSLPPTPKLAPGPSPTVSTPVHSFPAGPDPAYTAPPANHRPLPSLSSSYKKMLRRGSVSSAAASNKKQRTVMPPPAAPRQDEEWLKLTSFWDEIGATTTQVPESFSPIGPPGFGTAMDTTSSLMPTTPGGAGGDFAMLSEYMHIFTNHSNPQSPIIQQPLTSSTTPLSATMGYSPAMNHQPAEDYGSYLAHPGSAGSSDLPSEAFPSPAHPSSFAPSPNVHLWTEHELPLFPDPSPTVVSKTFPAPQHHPGLSLSAPMSSQESSTTSSSSHQSNALHPSSAPPATPILSPSSSKRPRLSADLSSSHGRYRSSSSSAAASPFIGASTKPTGYRRNVTPGDLTPLDAPTQRRNYVFDSKTARKDLPPSVTKTYKGSNGKRTSDVAGLPSRDEQPPVTATAGSSASGSPPQRGRGSGEDAMVDDSEDDEEKKDLREHVEQKRRANTIAARKSRQRKAEFISGLQGEISELRAQVDQLIEQNEQYRQRAEQAERQLKNLGFN